MVLHDINQKKTSLQIKSPNETEAKKIINGRKKTNERKTKYTFKKKKKKKVAIRLRL